MFAGNFLVRHWGRGRTGIDMRLEAAATRLSWPSLRFSERDIARFLAPLGFMRKTGAAMMNRRLAATAANWRPDVLFVSHCDYVQNSTLAEIRKALPSVKIVHINCDPVATAHCRAQIERRVESCDAVFATTAGPVLDRWKRPGNCAGFFPNPADPAFETEDNSLKDSFDYDLFFAGRPALADERAKLLDELEPLLPPGLRKGFFGMGKTSLVVGRDYEDAIARSKAGLSANRFEGWKWYASDRITHMMGNGLLTFQHSGNSMQDFFSENETAYYSSAAELADKLAFYMAHDDARKRVAAAGRARHNALFDAKRVLKCMVETVLGEEYSEDYEWAGEIRR